VTTEQQSHLNEVRAEIRARLQPICAEWPAELFESMVEHLAAVTIKYERQGSASPYDRRGTERLIADLKATLDRNEAARGKDEPPQP